MAVTISFDYNDESDREFILGLLSPEEGGVDDAEETPAPRAKSKAQPAADEPDGPTMEQAVERATELVGEGRAADVKGALANFGVKRVSELEESQIAEFLESLDGESVV